MKRLALMRHAKSSWQHAELSDFERPLNKRGLRDAPEMGRRLREANFRVDCILTSPARRAAVTAHTIAEAIDFPATDIVDVEELYLADPGRILDEVAALPSSCNSVMVFGHNPGFTQLANAIGNLEIDNMPTCSVAVFELPVENWSEIKTTPGRLLFFDYPKNTDKL